MRFERSSIPVRSAACAAGGFTLVELLVVVVIITILISAVLVASTALVTKAKVSATQAVLTVVRDAVEQFKREEAAPRNKFYLDRYGPFPPDELEVFTESGVPGSAPPPPSRSLGIGKAEIIPAPSSGGSYAAMKFYTKGLPLDEAALEHRDLVAMTIAILEYGDTSAQILRRIQDRYWAMAPLDDDGTPVLFLDRPDEDGKLNEEWDDAPETAGRDLQIRYIVDDWSVPISYLAQRNWDPNDPPEPSSNHERWNEVSTVMVRLNGGQPVIMSYGPDGKEQLTKDAMGNEALASLVGDFIKQEGEQHCGIDHHLNADNIYADPALKEKLAKEIE